MRLLHGQPDPRRRGAALLLSFLVLMVIIAIVYQLNRVTGTDQQVANKNLQLTKMDHAIRSAQLEVLEQLREDGDMRAGSEESGSGGSGGSSGSSGSGGPSDAVPSGDGGESTGSESNPDAVDSQMDEWAQVAATSVDDVQLRIYVEDEDRKYNILNMVVDDQELGDEAFDRVVRILDYCREQTPDDISSSDAEEMARVMRDHLMERGNSLLPRPELLNDDPERDRVGLPLTMREFLPLEPFEDYHFQDYLGHDDQRVHAITAYLTCYTSPATGGGAGQSATVAEGGHAVNVNTAPLAVLIGLFDSRDVGGRFWDSVLEYRNEEEELPPDQQPEEEEQLLDEFGNPIIQKQFFDSLDELSELRDWESMEPELRGRIEGLLRVTSDVFSITITARVPTSEERRRIRDFTSRLEQERYERSGLHLVRTVRAVYWRRIGEGEVELIPLVPWEVLDHAPLPVLDYPEEL